MANVIVERVHTPGNAPHVDAHLLLSSAAHNTAKHGGNHIDFGVVVTLFYQSGGKMVGLQSHREKLGGHNAKAVDSDTVRISMQVKYGNLRPDPGTKFTARAQLFTKHGNIDQPWGLAE